MLSIIALSVATLAACKVLSVIRARRVGGIVFIKAGNMNFTYSRSRRPRCRPVRSIDERQGYAPRAYAVPVAVAPAIERDERQGYPARAYVSR